MCLLISNAFEGVRLNREGDLFDLAKKMVSVLQCKVGKVKYEKLEVMQPRIKNKTEPPAAE